ncbi:hypothetical protein KUTeg_020069 [Tegillarca granosa]|uniref:Uncharacterized protein n=1 Tax=Tegillarca granosa TaxID=220873 RepID=A0ABQ9EB25_TEGGR|nr:hypothetical protein KUTeg_020069 [Tegillarca granosa]
MHFTGKSVTTNVKTKSFIVRPTAVLPLLPMQNIEDVWFYALEEYHNSDTNISTPTMLQTTVWRLIEDYKILATI